MSEHHDEPVLPPDQPAAEPRPRFRERVWGLPVVLAVALVAVLLGGLAGAAIASAGGHDHRGGPGFGRMGGPGGFVPPGQRKHFGGPGMGPGQGNGHGFGHHQWKGGGVTPSPRPTPTPSS